MPMCTPPLQQMIELWREIERLHFEDYVTNTTPRHDKLYAKAQIVVAALRHYQIELEER